MLLDVDVNALWWFFNVSAGTGRSPTSFPREIVSSDKAGRKVAYAWEGDAIIGSAMGTSSPFREIRSAGSRAELTRHSGAAEVASSLRHWERITISLMHLRVIAARQNDFSLVETVSPPDSLFDAVS